MLFVWGHRFYGHHDEVDRQHGMTRFGHLWFLPLFPMKALWITDARRKLGHPMRMTLRGVAHGYVRAWGLVVGLIALLAGLADGNLPAIGFGVVSLGLAVASLAGRRMRQERSLRRARYTRMTLGTACDPMVMAAEIAEALQPAAASEWARRAGTRTPDDVARLGAESLEQAAAAYTLLRLSARLERGAKGRRARATSEKILDATTELRLDGAPYRDELPASVEAPSV
ncbi:MAG TPA: hypothetical protein VHE35_17100 [Kofleriaceae bacterium]|nr:hypothetical protein [Kofleriaceae bacterium]